ncbi:MAG: hypothetical protein H6626_09385 [Pseudobdellovibrionaceae bacterium]|nr:hypothetical protein [Bdellovibrionales bacterium]USN46428.1 MAG: hypothetical protein H6626_09385 [Pseudobdellovibrionaceae bacterium]
MWIKRYTASQSRTPSYLNHQTRFIHRSFQIRYTAYLSLAATLGMVISMIPISYFINENYDVFIRLAYDYAPNILGHLEKEQIWLNSLLFSMFVGLVVFFTIFGFKLTARMIGPIQIVKNHLKQLSRGKWFNQEIKIRDKDEFHELIEEYNYFYKSFRKNLENDLSRLEKLNINRDDRESYYLWQKMIHEKQLQLGRTQSARPLNSFSKRAS